MPISVSNNKGVLYVVATPIGNLDDMSPRAVSILQSVDKIAAEDTRHSQRLLRHYGISTPCFPYHDHVERQLCDAIVMQIENGASIALISDAGTPLVSDPGYHLVKLAQQKNLRVVPVPGPSALITALSASGLASDRFAFEGYLPAKTIARQKKLSSLLEEPRTLIFYESPHRIVDTVADLLTVFGPQRQATIARELTKTFETIKKDTIVELSQWLKADRNQQKGEFVILIAANVTSKGDHEISSETKRILQILLDELPVKQAAALTARISGEKKNALYQYALELTAE